MSQKHVFTGHPSPAKKYDTRGLSSFNHTLLAWPGQKVRGPILRADGKMRMALRKLFRLGIVENKHVYKK